MMVLWLDGGGVEERTIVHRKGRSSSCVGQKRGLQLSQAQLSLADADDGCSKTIAALTG